MDATAGRGTKTVRAVRVDASADVDPAVLEGAARTVERSADQPCQDRQTFAHICARLVNNSGQEQRISESYLWKP
jgi:hypothetical protein